MSAACGPTSGHVGVSDGPPSRRPVDLALVTPERTFIDLVELRGRPVLLFLFATFDVQSQAALRPLRRFMIRRPDVQVVGVGIQPQARNLLRAWRSALTPPFPVTFEPDNRIARGVSDLGNVEAIPTFVLLDERGFEQQRVTGFVNADGLERLLAGGG